MPAETKDRLITFRVSEAQERRFQRAAEVECTSVSEWLRRLALLRVAELGSRVEANGASE